MSDKMDAVEAIRNAIAKASAEIDPIDKIIFSSPVVQLTVKLNDFDDATRRVVQTDEANPGFVVPSVIYGVTGVAEQGGSFTSEIPLEFQISSRASTYEASALIDKKIWEQLKAGRLKPITTDYQDDYDDIGEGIYISNRTVVFLG